ncbi:MAG: EAL domain-containing protein, partial [Terracidiphilus sp.]
ICPLNAAVVMPPDRLNGYLAFFGKHAIVALISVGNPLTVMRVHSLRLRAIAATVSLGAVAGLLIGILWSREVILRASGQKLSSFADRIRLSGERSSDEARKVLQELNRLPYAPCSDAELAAFRHAVYTSVYLNDAGRVANGTIPCSAFLGRLAQPWAGFDAGYLRPDGSRVYRDLAPYQVPGQTVVAVQSGHAIVVYNPYNLRNFASQTMRFVATDWDFRTGQIRRLIGTLPDQEQPAQILTQPVLARFRGVLYSTSCSQRYATCITAYIAIPDALQAERVQYRIYIGLSALCGGLLGLALALFYLRNRSIEQQLRRAVRKDRLGIAFQPIFDLQSGRAVAAEALARWTDEDGFPVSPEIFIKVAEARGFIGDITRFMVVEVLRALEQTAPVDPDFRISVNIAPADVNDPRFLLMLSRARRRSPVPARCLGFEITECSQAEWDSARDLLITLRQFGHLVHIDDFGKGYSSLAQLYHLPVDGLKIDKEFTQSIGTDSVKTSITPQILAMAASLQLNVVIEGIETEEQARYYAGCRPPVLAQGWYLGRPMFLDDLLQLLRGRTPYRGLYLVRTGTAASGES